MPRRRTRYVELGSLDMSHTCTCSLGVSERASGGVPESFEIPYEGVWSFNFSFPNVMQSAANFERKNPTHNMVTYPIHSNKHTWANYQFAM